MIFLCTSVSRRFPSTVYARNKNDDCRKCDASFWFSFLIVEYLHLKFEKAGNPLRQLFAFTRKRLTRNGMRKPIRKRSCCDSKYGNNTVPVASLPRAYIASLLHHKYDVSHLSHTFVVSRVSSLGGGRVARLHADQLAEGLTEFGVEHSVYYGIHEAVHVAQPRGDDERGDTRLTILCQLCADRIHNVASEEGHPAYQKDTCNIYSFIPK